MSAPTREQKIADMRTLLDFLEQHPDVPIRDLGVTYCISDADDLTGLAKLGDAADAVEVSVTSSDGTHHYAFREFGTAWYKAFYVTKQHMDEYYAGLKHLRECAETAGAVSE